MNKIEFINKTLFKIKDLELLKEILNYTISKEKVKDPIFSVVFVNNHKIKKINKKYRGINKSTDVITFAFLDDQTYVNESYNLLGEIYISLNKAKKQAKKYGHSLQRELAFLLIHGFLHLLQYDHQSKKEENIMFKKQEDILNEFRLTRTKKENGN